MSSTLERFFNPVYRPFSLNITNLPGAKLYFYQAGTSTLKTVYQDRFGNVAHANPVVADSSGSFPPIFLNGLYRVELTDSSDITQDGWPVDNVGNDSVNPVFGPWSETYNYGINDIVFGSDDEWYKSIASDNLGNDPVTSPEEWSRLVFLGFYNEFETYQEDDLVVFDGRLWRSLQDDNLGNEPEEGSAFWVDPTSIDIAYPNEVYTDDYVASVGLVKELDLYKGPWDLQTGEAAPPYLVSMGGAANYVLESETLSVSPTWARNQLADVVDSGIAAPSINGQDFGNYYKIIPNTTTTVHSLAQTLTGAGTTGQATFLVKDGGYPGFLFRLNGSSGIIFEVRFSGGTFTTGAANASAMNLGDGSWLIELHWDGLASTPTTLQTFIRNGAGSESFAGNGTDGLLMTRVQGSPRGARYATTTTTAVEYTPPEFYSLQQYQADVTATEPGTDEAVWLELGSSASQAPSELPVVDLGEVATAGGETVDLDLSLGNTFLLSCVAANTTGALTITVSNAPANNWSIFIILRRPGRKAGGVVFPASWDWAVDTDASSQLTSLTGTDDYCIVNVKHLSFYSSTGALMTLQERETDTP